MPWLAPEKKSFGSTTGIEVWEPLPSTRRNALCRATLVLSPSRATADHLVSVQGVDHDRIRVLPWALDPNFPTRFSGAAPTQLPGAFPPARWILSVAGCLATD